VFSTNFDDSLHIATLSAYKSPCHLKVFFVLNLNVKSTSVLNLIWFIVLVLRILNGCAILYWLEVFNRSLNCKHRIRLKLRWLSAMYSKDILGLKQTRLYRLVFFGSFLNMLLGIPFIGGKSTDVLCFILILITHLMKALRLLCWLQLYVIVFTRHPFDDECRVVICDEVIVEVLLHNESRNEVFECYERVILFLRHTYWNNFSEGRKNLQYSVTQLFHLRFLNLPWQIKTLLSLLLELEI